MLHTFRTRIRDILARNLIPNANPACGSTSWMTRYCICIAQLPLS